MPALKKAKEVERVIERIRRKMKPWGITVTFLAGELGVSRQYAWQIVHYRTFLSQERILEIEKVVDSIIVKRKHLSTFGERLRAARISAGFTLKQVASMIGYSWVGVERWEKNICLPKPGVLWHLCTVYCIGEDWLMESPAVAVRPRAASFGARERNSAVGIRGELVDALRPNSIIAPVGSLGHHTTFPTPRQFVHGQRRLEKTQRKDT